MTDHKHYQIQTVEQYRSTLQTILETSIEDQQLIWSINVYNAHVIFSSCTTKDLAEMLNDGIKACNTLEGVQEFLDTFFEEVDLDDPNEEFMEQVQQEVNRFLAYVVCDVFGNHELGLQIHDE